VPGLSGKDKEAEISNREILKALSFGLLTVFAVVLLFRTSIGRANETTDTKKETRVIKTVMPGEKLWRDARWFHALSGKRQP